MRTRIMMFALILSVAGGAFAQVRQYAAKFVCGRADDKVTEIFDFAPGSYYTTINVHDPELSGGIKFRKKFALAMPNEQGGKISEWFGAALKADQAMQIDCGSIYKHLGIPFGTFIDGFAVIQLPDARRELDVVGVYTAAGGNGVSSIHTERVAGRITQ